MTAVLLRALPLCLLAMVCAALHHPSELAKGSDGRGVLPLSPLKRTPGGPLSTPVTMRLHGGFEAQCTTKLCRDRPPAEHQDTGGYAFDGVTSPGDERRDPGGYAFDGVTSPGDDWVPVAITYPGPARGHHSSVSIVGTWDSWKTPVPLAPSPIKEDSSWSVVFRVPPGTHEFKFLVNGRWALASNWSIVSDRVGSNGNHVLEAPKGNSVVRYNVDYDETPASEQQQLAQSPPQAPLAGGSRSEHASESNSARRRADGLEAPALSPCRTRKSASSVLAELLQGLLQIASLLIITGCMGLWSASVVSIVRDTVMGPLSKRSYRSALL